MVHYVAYGTPGGEYPAGVCRAAVVTETYSLDSGPIPRHELVTVERDGSIGDVGLCVLNPTGQFFNRAVRHDEEKAPGTWHWPEREPE